MPDYCPADCSCRGIAPAWELNANDLTDEEVQNLIDEFGDEDAVLSILDDFRF
jgi:hypothetical protein